MERSGNIKMEFQQNQNQSNVEYEHFNNNGTKRKAGKEKKKGKGMLAVLFLLVLAVVGANSLVITKENQYKLIRRFGRVERVIATSGLSFKMPFVESVDVIPNQLLLYDLPASDVITSDKKTMIVDSYVLWQVNDPLKFAQTLSGSVSNAERRIDTIVYNATKNTISNMKQDEVIVSRDGKMTITVDHFVLLHVGDSILGSIVYDRIDTAFRITHGTAQRLRELQRIRHMPEHITVHAHRLLVCCDDIR